MSTSEAPPSAYPTPADRLQGRALVSSAVTDHGTPRALVAGTQVRLTFGSDTHGAEAGCNALSFPLQVEPDRLVVGDGISSLIGCAPVRRAHMNFEIRVTSTQLTVADDVASTRIACSAALQAQDTWLSTFLIDDPAYTFVDGTLTLTRGSTTIVLVSTPEATS